MKKKNFKSLLLNKSIVSNFVTIKGGFGDPPPSPGPSGPSGSIPHSWLIDCTESCYGSCESTCTPKSCYAC